MCFSGDKDKEWQYGTGNLWASPIWLPLNLLRSSNLLLSFFIYLVSPKIFFILNILLNPRKKERVSRELNLVIEVEVCSAIHSYEAALS